MPCSPVTVHVGHTSLSTLAKVMERKHLDPWRNRESFQRDDGWHIAIAYIESILDTS